jgi:hypothetical protein
MKYTYLILFCLFSSLVAMAQVEPDSTLTIKEINFRDSIAAINSSNADLQLLQETFNVGTEAFSSAKYRDAIASFNQVLSLDSLYVMAYYNLL